MAHPLEHKESAPSAITNLIVLAALMVLLAMTMGLAMIDLDRYLPGHGWSTAVALAIASAKALLVLAYFMHLKYSNHLATIFAGAGFLWLSILIVYLIVEVYTG